MHNVTILAVQQVNTSTVLAFTNSGGDVLETIYKENEAGCDLDFWLVIVVGKLN